MNADGKSANENLVTRIWNGNASLVMTYWVYGVLAGFVWGFALGALQPVPGSGTAKIFLVCMAAYFVVVYVGTWRAASKYKGKKAWARLAKLSVSLGALITVVPVVVGLFHSFVS